MSNGGPAKDELETKKASSTAAPKTASASTTETITVTTAPEQKEKAKKEKKKTKEGFKNITMTEKFYCRAKDLYDILMDENRWKGFTQSNARISREVGGQFSIFDGSISGVHEELQEGKVIVQKWRSGSWPDGLFSSVWFYFIVSFAFCMFFHLSVTLGFFMLQFIYYFHQVIVGDRTQFLKENVNKKMKHKVEFMCTIHTDSIKSFSIG